MEFILVCTGLYCSEVLESMTVYSSVVLKIVLVNFKEEPWNWVISHITWSRNSYVRFSCSGFRGARSYNLLPLEHPSLWGSILKMPDPLSYGNSGTFFFFLFFSFFLFPFSFPPFSILCETFSTHQRYWIAGIDISKKLLDAPGSGLWWRSWALEIYRLDLNCWSITGLLFDLRQGTSQWLYFFL